MSFNFLSQANRVDTNKNIKTSNNPLKWVNHTSLLKYIYAMYFLVLHLSAVNGADRYHVTHIYPETYKLSKKNEEQKELKTLASELLTKTQFNILAVRIESLIQNLIDFLEDEKQDPNFYSLNPKFDNFANSDDSSNLEELDDVEKPDNIDNSNNLNDPDNGKGLDKPYKPNNHNDAENLKDSSNLDIEKPKEDMDDSDLNKEKTDNSDIETEDTDDSSTASDENNDSDLVKYLKKFTTSKDFTKFLKNGNLSYFDKIDCEISKFKQDNILLEYCKKIDKLKKIWPDNECMVKFCPEMIKRIKRYIEARHENLELLNEPMEGFVNALFRIKNKCCDKNSGFDMNLFNGAYNSSCYIHAYNIEGRLIEISWHKYDTVKDLRYLLFMIQTENK